MDASNRYRHKVRDRVDHGQVTGHALAIVHDLNLEMAMQEMYPVLRQKAENVVSGKISNQIGLSDLAMNTLMVGLVRARDFQGKSQNQLERWLVGIMKNLYRRSRRDLLRRRRLEFRYSQSLPDPRKNHHVDGLMASRPNDPANDACQKEMLEFLQKALNLLPYRLRQVIELKLAEGLSISQIADRLEIEIEAASKRYQRALTQLREMYVIQQIAENITN